MNRRSTNTTAGIAEIEADEVGLAILKPLRRLDVVAYLRFASVYQAFSDLDDFENAIEVLRSMRSRQDKAAVLILTARGAPEDGSIRCGSRPSASSR